MISHMKIKAKKYKSKLNVVKVGQKFLPLVGKNWNSFVKFRRLPGGHTCQIKQATCNILICLRNIVILRKSGGEKVNVFLKELVFRHRGYHAARLKSTI